MEKYKRKIEEISTANYKRNLKGRIIFKLEQMGISASATDSAEIVIFSSKPINNKSIKLKGIIKNPI